MFLVADDFELILMIININNFVTFLLIPFEDIPSMTSEYFVHVTNNVITAAAKVRQKKKIERWDDGDEKEICHRDKRMRV